MGETIETIIVHGLDPKDDALIKAVEQRCSAMPEIPVELLDLALDFVLLEPEVGAVGGRKASLYFAEWAAAVGLVKRKAIGRIAPPDLWVLYEDGFRHVGMRGSDLSLQPSEFDTRTTAHWDSTILLTFPAACDPDTAWARLKAFRRWQPDTAGVLHSASAPYRHGDLKPRWVRCKPRHKNGGSNV
ncbi:hypothetical protein EPN44_01385 [bacterium]|nr:MAG: hypothetical protein EPN44_01385 [bacterium]